MLVDEVEIIFKAGHGGAGRASFYPKLRSGPDGGNGGKGGDVYVIATSDLTALEKFSGKHLWEAENGQPGGSNQKSGANGKDIEVTLPVGTSLINVEAGEEEVELTKPGQKVLVVKGGWGGKGNYELRSSRNTTPKYAQPGLPGQEKHYLAVLKLIADFGLIGFPNAGKSSLLNEITAAQVKVGNYAFTTLEPNLGVYQALPAGRQGKIIADIPGLIEGASSGKGLGIKFLKHIEKVKLLLHVISAESQDVVKDYQTVRAELQKFNPELLKKPEIILLSKSDLVDKKDLEQKTKQLRKGKKRVLSISVYNYEEMENLKKLLESS